MSTSILARAFAYFFGPSGTRVAYGSFTTAGTGAVTTLEAHGFTVARSGVGTFLVTMRNPCKGMVVSWAAQFTTTAQVPLITALSASAGTFTVSIVTAASGTAVETTGLTLHLQVIQRMNS